MKRSLLSPLFAAAMLFAAGPLSASECEEGFVPLFDGKSLDGWQNTEGYEVKDGILICTEEGKNLFTKKQYSDFVVRLDYNLEAGGNNGVGIRCPLEGVPAFAGIEIQILDNDDGQHRNIKPYQYNGSVYGIIAAKAGHENPPGEWNSMEITAKGRDITVKLNGHTIVEGNLDKATADGTLDGREHPGLERDSGYIGLLGHRSRVEFRNIRIKTLE